jgi:ABC-type dipeptide/oligopeptide/nickel transport system permease subunit
MMASVDAVVVGRSGLLLGAERVRRGRLHQAGRRLRRRPGALAGAVVILFFVAVALLAPVIAPADPNEISRDRRAAPSGCRRESPRSPPRSSR